MNIRRLTLDDLKIAEKLVEKFKGRIRQQSALREFLSHPNNILIGAIDGNQPVGMAIGYILARTETGSPMLYIHDVEVAVHTRRQGTGREIIEVFKQVTRESNALKMFVITDRDNKAAMGLYESAGAKASVSDDVVFEWREIT